MILGECFTKHLPSFLVACKERNAKTSNRERDEPLTNFSHCNQVR